MLLRLTLLLLCLTGLRSAAAQPVPIAAGDRVKLLTIDGGRRGHVGTFVRQSEKEIWIQTRRSADSVVPFQRAQIQGIQRSLGHRHHARKGSWVAGTLVGVPVGTFVFFRQRYHNRQCKPELSLPGECEASYVNPAKAALVVGGLAGLGAAPWGAFIGWLIRTERWAPVDLDIAVNPNPSDGMVSLRWKFGMPDDR